MKKREFLLWKELKDRCEVREGMKGSHVGAWEGAAFAENDHAFFSRDVAFHQVLPRTRIWVSYFGCLAGESGLG